MIESLHSPHIGGVKALLGSRGKKERKESGFFVAEGIQCHSFHLHLFYLSSSFLSSSLSFFPPSFLSPFRTLYCLLINYILPYPLRSTTCFHSFNFFLFLFSLILLYSYLRRLSRIVYVKTNIFQFCLDSSPRHHSLLIS